MRVDSDLSNLSDGGSARRGLNSDIHNVRVLLEMTAVHFHYYTSFKKRGQITDVQNEIKGCRSTQSAIYVQAIPKTLIQRTARPNHLIMHYRPEGHSEFTTVNMQHTKA